MPDKGDNLLLLDVTCGRDLLDCQVIPGCFQHVSDTRAGEWEEELLDTAEHTWILKLIEWVLVCGTCISWLEVTGHVVSLHSNLTVCKESCSSPPCLLCKKQSCLTCKKSSQNYKQDLGFQAVLSLQGHKIKKNPSLIYCLYPISAHLFPQQMLWADFMLYLIAQGFTGPVGCL